jgi:hypothetical protein
MMIIIFWEMIIIIEEVFREVFLCGPCQGYIRS